jgi:HCOMODA/2-hydroxy-3-carboxy-muconic semialdehyde decarboxylase
LVHAYGHCSARLDAERFVVCAATPMGLIRPGVDGAVVPVSGPLPPGVLGEVRIHQQIYRRRPEVRGVCRTMPPNAVAVSTMGESIRPRHGLGSYFAPRVPLWDDPRLLRSDGAAEKLTAAMADAPGILMRGNGAVTAASSLEAAVVFAWFLEDAARVELAARQAGAAEHGILGVDEARDRAVSSGRIFERMWDFMTAGDPEAGAMTEGFRLPGEAA